MQLRQATLHDVPDLLPLVRAYWSLEELPDFDDQRVGTQLARLLSEARFGAGWMAINDGTPVGYLLAVYVFSLEYLGLTAEIDEFFVLPAYRGLGVGHVLLAEAEAALIHSGCTTIALQIAHNNDAARSFYHRHGYHERSGFELLTKTLLTD